ncbi:MULTISPECIES: pirin family protein [unclassified Streptomyces]|uniref:pirin family protein n=1 Tax=unclassified Streptomyces TaxID=2593676 RepID=UPI000B83FB11|nr:MULTISPECIES: pirin family protein [unclassified Streptomyces]MYR24990.1 cupin domain-containing protein [Streptomyces sp. SID4945]
MGAVIDVRRGADRYPGGEPDAGITTRHAFSFGPHYDPDNLRLGPLTACNEERLAPGAGFAEHRHSDTELLTWVVSGELRHRDAEGRSTVVRPGDLQHLGAGSGVHHVERNDGAEPLVFLQFWLAARTPALTPRYTLVRSLARPYEVPEAGAVLRLARPAPGATLPLPAGPYGYVHVVRGEAELAGGERLAAGDAVRVRAGADVRGTVLRARTACEVLLLALADPFA